MGKYDKDENTQRQEKLEPVSAVCTIGCDPNNYRINNNSVMLAASCH